MKQHCPSAVLQLMGPRQVICAATPQKAFKVSKLLEDTEEKMSDLIHEYNESIENDENETEIDTVDLSSKFDDLKDYIEDYS